MNNTTKIREEAKKLNPIDDLMFRKMAEDKEFCQEILCVILEDDKLIVLESIPQWSHPNNKFPKASGGKHRYKETEGGLNAMCEIMEKIAKEERTKGKMELLFDLAKDGIITIAEAAKRADMTETVFTESMKQFKA